MKRFNLLILMMGFFLQQGVAQPLYLNSQTKVAGFAGTEEYDGDIYISRSSTYQVDRDEVNDLRPLSSLKKITGKLIIEQTQITDLSGLENLETIGDQLMIKNNSKLTSIANLTKLSSLNYFSIFNNPKLSDCCIFFPILNNSPNNSFSNNNAGCNSKTELENQCNASIPPALTCNVNNGKVSLLSKEKQTIKLLVHWNENPTLMPRNLNLTNATCVDCKKLGGLGRPHGSEKIYIIQQTDPSKNVEISYDWGSCGLKKMIIPANLEKVNDKPFPEPAGDISTTLMKCDGSKSNGRIEFMSKNDQTVKLKVHWDENSGFGIGSIDIDNGNCVSCPNVGGIGRPNGKEKIYEIRRLIPDQPMYIKYTWSGCGNDVMHIPNQ